jgi:hypothetical protein
MTGLELAFCALGMTPFLSLCPRLPRRKKGSTLCIQMTGSFPFSEADGRPSTRCASFEALRSFAQQSNIQGVKQ